MLRATKTVKIVTFGIRYFEYYLYVYESMRSYYLKAHKNGTISKCVSIRQIRMGFKFLFNKSQYRFPLNRKLLSHHNHNCDTSF